MSLGASIAWIMFVASVLAQGGAPDLSHAAALLKLDALQTSSKGEKPPVDTRLLAQALSPTVVSLKISNVDGSNSQATGFYIRHLEQTLIVTNAHAIISAERVTVREKGRDVLDATGIYLVSPTADIAVLGIGKYFTFSLPLAEQNPDVGERIVVIGNPRGLERSITEGIVSAVRGEGDAQMLQISAPISPGSSGSPVLDSLGKVVGIAAGGLKESQALNFAVPVEVLRALLQRDAADASLSRDPVPFAHLAHLARERESKRRSSAAPRAKVVRLPAQKLFRLLIEHPELGLRPAVADELRKVGLTSPAGLKYLSDIFDKVSAIKDPELQKAVKDAMGAAYIESRSVAAKKP